MANQMEGILSGDHGFESSKKFLTTVEHPYSWMFLLAGAGLVSSLQSACAAPLIGLSIAGTGLFSRSKALFTTGVIWAINQIVGFTFLHYPQTENTILWGFILGVAMIGSTYGAQRMLIYFSDSVDVMKLTLSFLFGFGVYEAILYIASFRLGGTNGFSMGILSKVFITNAIVFFGLNLIHFNLKKFSQK